LFPGDRFSSMSGPFERLAGNEVRQDRARTPHWKIAARAVAAALLLAAVTVCFAMGPTGHSSSSALVASFAAPIDRWIVAQGLGIEQVSLEGHRFTTDADIFDALDLPNAGSMLRFNGTDAAARILRLPWVQRVQIKPLVPNGLHLVITERTPYAVWEHDAGPGFQPGKPAGQAGRRLLVDQTGHVLAAIGPEAFNDLPRVRGEGAAAAAADLHSTLALFPAIATRLTVAERIGGRRWSLALDNGLRIHMPAGQEASALQHLAALQANHRLLDRAIAEIDLRAPGVTVRPHAASPSALSSVPQM
jgi:cell division protein FtsQ